jgi:hypothetical protein
MRPNVMMNGYGRVELPNGNSATLGEHYFISEADACW